MEGRSCYNCDNYISSYFCGYYSSHCKIHGSLDMDQHERHPDTAADQCAEYTPKKPKQPETPEDRIRKMQRALWPNGYNPRRR